MTGQVGEPVFQLFALPVNRGVMKALTLLFRVGSEII
jgi:hypothetical protein